MKLSFYNHHVDYGKYYIYYNAFTNSYLLIKNEYHELFQKHKNDLDELKQQNSEFYNDLVDGGFIVDNELDQQSIIFFEKNRAKFLSNNYNVMINPTLDCNLKCWYCYENHKLKSTMSPKVMDSILKNIEQKFATDPFSSLSIGFFGGEPLMKTNNVVIPFIQKVENFVKEKDIHLTLGITTNGTVMNEKLLSVLKPHNVSFQITFDGSEELHNKVRCYKNGYHKSFPMIIKNLHKIQKSLDNYTITLRINYDNETLEDIEGLVDSLSFLDPKEAVFHLNRVWQVAKEDIIKENLIYAVNYIMEKGYIANLCALARGGSTCYADNINQLLVNYDGLVFKCTSKDFTDQNKEGVLQDDGTIKWDMNKLSRRMGTLILDMCKNCKLLPCCRTMCSQEVIDNQDLSDIPCYLEINPLPFNDYIAYNFRRAMLADKLELVH